jgi:hypothetical protein
MQAIGTTVTQQATSKHHQVDADVGMTSSAVSYIIVANSPRAYATVCIQVLREGAVNQNGETVGNLNQPPQNPTLL